MVERQEVEELVREIEEGCREHSCTPHDMSLDVEGDTLAALCRAWLAVDAGAPAIMDTREFLSLCAPTEDDFPALYALQGKSVRLVPVGGDDEQG